MSVTKKPKKIKIKKVEWTEYRLEFTCPSCFITYMNDISINVLRLRCRNCGQELIVDNPTPLKEKP